MELAVDHVQLWALVLVAFSLRVLLPVVVSVLETRMNFNIPEQATGCLKQ
jgi:hypothetical protein